MIVRIWRTAIDPSRTTEYERFEDNESMHTFLRQPGFIAVLFVRTKGQCATVTFWEDMRSVEALATSTTYQETLKQLEATGMLVGKQSVEVFEVKGGYLPSSQVLEPASNYI